MTRLTIWAAAGAALAAVACAPKQVVPLDVEPNAAVLYLDGSPVEGRPPNLELRADRDHKLYFKREGYRPELVVLRTIDDGSGPKLQPAEVTVRLEPRSRGSHRVEIERAD